LPLANRFIKYKWQEFKDLINEICLLEKELVIERKLKPGSKDEK